MFFIYTIILISLSNVLTIIIALKNTGKNVNFYDAG
jgi:hypothetical protein